jgi:hypothetical protein
LETNGNGKTLNKPGLYRHPESGAEVFVTHHPKLGSAMADGVVAQGYKWVQAELPKKLALGKDPNATEEKDSTKE